MTEEKQTTGQAGIPDEVYDFIDDLSAIDRIEALIARHHLTNTKVAFHELNAVPDAIALGKMKPDDLAGHLARTLKLEPAAAGALARDTVADLLGPVAKHLPEVERFLSLSERASAKPKEAAEHPVQQVSANVFVHGELEKYKLELPEEHLQKKFERVLSEFVAKTKTREETLQALTRPRKVGGLGLDEHASERLLDGLSEDAKHIPVSSSAKKSQDPSAKDQTNSKHEILNSKQIPSSKSETSKNIGDSGSVAAIGDEIPGRTLSEFVPDRDLSPEVGERVPREVLALSAKSVSTPKPKPLPPRTIVKIEDVLAPPVEGKSEIPSTKSETNSKLEIPISKPKFDAMTVHPDDDGEIEAHKEKVPSGEPLHDIEAMTQKTIAAIVGAKELDAEGKKKLHAIVKTRLNGIRDAYKTRAALESAEGLGWSGGELTQALEEIEKTYGKLEAAGVEKVEREKREYVAKRAARFVSGSTTQNIGDSGSVAAIGDEIPNRRLSEFVPNRKLSLEVGERVPREGSALSASVVPNRDLSPEVGERVPREGSALSAQGAHLLPRDSAGIPRFSSPPLKRRGKVRDVAAPRKLSGPVEELEGMTIADFRRLGSTGEEAAAEVHERLKLLEDQSYGLRLKGIAAWRRSPLYETYISIISEAMQSEGGMEAVLRAHKSAGEEMLTLEEVRALIRLNGTLRV